MLKSFAEARDFIEIDKKIMAEAKRWILRKQSKDGCFPTVGSLHNKAMKVYLFFLLYVCTIKIQLYNDTTRQGP